MSQSKLTPKEFDAITRLAAVAAAAGQLMVNMSGVAMKDKDLEELRKREPEVTNFLIMFMNEISAVTSAPELSDAIKVSREMCGLQELFERMYPSEN